MQIIPAIDIWKGKLVRLFQGSYEKPIFYPLTPLQAAKKWKDKNFKRIHIIDLEGAREGRPCEKDLIIEVAKEFGGKVQVGGGIRKKEDIEFYIEKGISYIILGTKGLEKDFLLRMTNKFPKRIIVSLDIKDNRIKISGWEKETNANIEEFLNFLSSLPLESIIITDIKKDGTMEGISKDFFLNISKFVNIPIIAAGGISSKNDIIWLKENIENIKGVIIGKAMYEGNEF